jgi:plastocyanin
LRTESAASETRARRGRARLAVVPVLAGLVVLAGCGSSSKTTSSSSTPATPATTASTPATTASTTSTGSEAASGASTPLKLEANSGGQLEYNTKSLSAKAGKVSIEFANSSPVGHNVTIESSGGQTVGATPTFDGGTKTLNVTLKPGTYKFFCSVPGHRQAGMEGTLTVQ